MSDLIYEKELLNSLRTEMTLFWTSAFIFGGGGIAFWVGAGGVQSWSLSIAGWILAIVCSISFFGRRILLKDTLNDLQNLKYKRGIE
jgi:hypothetical protein